MTFRDDMMSKGILVAFGIGGLMFAVIIIGDLLT